ncbi:MAG: DNA-binding protein WhiA [Lachnospiraceae bacterium]|nr:DNA-binding protein WhiA [Lachnospiraceae bacterium]
MISFSAATKEALSVLPVKPIHCKKAELSAIASCIGLVDFDEDDRLMFVLQSESLPVMIRAEYLISSLCGKAAETSVIRGARGKTALFSLTVSEPAMVISLLKGLGYMTAKGVLREFAAAAPKGIHEFECCRRAFLRGVFLASGYLRDPNTDYHLELKAVSDERAEELRRLLQEFGLEAKLTRRKGAPIVYLKEAEAISDFLSLIGASKSKLEFENVRILRGIQGEVNRRVNCETANLKKSANAGMNQAEAIEKIEAAKGLRALPDQLREIAVLRRDNPDISLQELGMLMDPPLGKSGVNHRLRKLMEIAEQC